MGKSSISHRPDRVTPAPQRLRRFAPVAALPGAGPGRQSEILLYGAVLELLRHPCLDMLPEFTPEPATLFAFLLADHIPRGFQRVRANPTSVQRHLGAIDDAADVVRPPASESQADRVNLVQVAEDLAA